MTSRFAFLGRSLLAGGAAAGAVLACTFARADESADTAAARLLGWDGVTLADSGNCAQAVDKLRRAEKLHHAPTTAARLGECEVDMGMLVAGTERLQRVLREPLPAGTPAAFGEAIARARAVLDRALPKVGDLRISVHAPAGSRFVVSVDGEPLPDALLDNDRPTDPGAHRVQVAGTGFFTSTKDVSLGDGETKTVVLELDRNFNAPLSSSPAPSPVRAGAAAPAVAEGAGFPVGPVVAFALGGIGLATGIAAGLAVAGKASDLATSCDGSRVCPPGKQSEINAAKTWAAVSTGGFIAAGAGLGTGLVLLLTGKSEARSASTGASADPVVGPGYVGIHGRF
jgi:hypothetical protein